jgi:hypothetical protein
MREGIEARPALHEEMGMGGVWHVMVILERGILFRYPSR